MNTPQTFQAEKQALLLTLLKLAEPEIIIEGNINSDMVTYVRWSLTFLRTKGSPPVTIRFNTEGGSLLYGKHIYDCIRTYTGHTIGLVDGECSSAGVTALLGCKVRNSLEHSRFLIHTASNSFDVATLRNPAKLAKATRSLFAAESEKEKIYVRHTGLTLKQIRKLTANPNDESMTAEEAKKYGFIDKII